MILIVKNKKFIDFWKLSFLQDLLVPVFENGKMLKEYSLNEIREKAEISSNDIDIFKFLKEDAAKTKSTWG